MRRLVWTASFLRAFKRCMRQHSDFKVNVEQVLRLLVDDPFDSRLRTHKLKGKLEGAWACSVTYELRLVFEFVKGANKQDDVLLIELGTNEEVY